MSETRAILRRQFDVAWGLCAYHLDGLTTEAIAGAMRAGIDAACRPGVKAISAGNYGGKLGPYQFPLRQIMSAAP